MNANPKFVVGIGSQRAGSTLLHKVLDECTSIFMHPVKELHYFDTKYQIRKQEVLTKYSQNQLERELERITSSKDMKFLNDKRYKCYLRSNRLLAYNTVDNIDYIDLYRPCLLGNSYVGEITPEYMILPDAGIKELASTVGKDAKIILITRDPIDRFISAFKLLKAYGNTGYDFENFETDMFETISAMPSWVEQQVALNDYDTAVAKYAKYFESVLTIRYDELVERIEDTHRKLEDFLGISVDLEAYKRLTQSKVNQIGESKSISEDGRSTLEKVLGIAV